MNILVIGSGGREHALCWKLRQSEKVEDLYCAPGNGGTGQVADNIDLAVDDHDAVAAFCGEKKIDLVVVGPEAPLAVGMADDLRKAGIDVFGPSYAGARLESSKIFSKELMGACGIPTAPFRIFSDVKKAEEYIREQDRPLVVKAYGLAAGKGVVLAETADEAVDAAERMLVAKEFGVAGKEIIVEEYLTGEEASILVVCDGKNVVPLVTSQDHKQVLEGDQGPNTGGMGAYSPAPVIDDEGLNDEIMKTVIKPTIRGLQKAGVDYRGVLYAGLMITEKGPMVLEYNVRFGDPETQVILPRLKSDLAGLLSAAAKGDIAGMDLEWDERDCVSVVLASGGYPGVYEKGKEISGIKEAEATGAIVFHAGTRSDGGRVLTSGGRVLNVTALGHGVKEAVDNAYAAVEKITFEDMHYRRDIGYKAVARVNNKT